jgi:hypothetical protein
MRLVEQELLLQAAFAQVEAMEERCYGILHTKFYELDAKLVQGAGLMPDSDEREMVAALVSPRLLTVWFNAW